MQADTDLPATANPDIVHPNNETSGTRSETGVLAALRRAGGLWLDSRSGDAEPTDGAYQVDWLRIIPFIGLHLAVLGVFWVGWSPVAVAVAVAMYAVRMFAITAFYHRYFSHRSYKTSRWCQFLFAVLGNSAVQRGPLWWAGHHRHHHRYSDQAEDVHSPRQHGLLWSHIGWITSRTNFPTKVESVGDLAKYPELRFLDRFDNLVPLTLAAGMFALGKVLETQAPSLGTSGWQMLVWGFFVSTVALSHATFCINSLTHCIGRQRYRSKDDSRNSLILALLTFGEGWHNNHHYYPGSVRQGFFWYEIDLSYYVLWVMARLGLIWDLHTVPAHVRDAQQRMAGAPCVPAAGE